MDRSCLNCRFWEPNGEEGLCRRYAPRPLVNSNWSLNSPAPSFPITGREEWCGEFEDKALEDD